MKNWFKKASDEEIKRIFIVFLSLLWIGAYASLFTKNVLLMAIVFSTAAAFTGVFGGIKEIVNKNRIS